MAPPRILLAGDVLGHLNQLYKRLSLPVLSRDTSDRLEEFMDYIEGRNTLTIPIHFIDDYGAGAPKVLSTAAKDSGNLGFTIWVDGVGVVERNGVQELGGTGTPNHKTHTFKP